MTFSTLDQDSENARYARHFALSQVGPAGQKKLGEARVLLIGVGGLGSPAALYLTAAGVGHLGLVDDDQVSLGNLQRQILYSTPQVSLDKVDCARERLVDLNPLIEVRTFKTRVTTENILELIAGYDIVVDGSDNFATRYLVNEACTRLQKPLVFGAIFRFDGQLSVFGRTGSPCYRCLYPEAPPAEAVPGCSEAGVLGVLPGVIGTLMATEVMKLILGLGEPLFGQLLIYEALGTSFRRLSTSRRTDCPTCGDEPRPLAIPSPTEILTIAPQELREWLRQAKATTLVDVRSNEEFARGHLPGALNIPLPELAREVAKIPNGDPLVLICQSGQRSRRAFEILRPLMSREIYSLEGGVTAWNPAPEA